MDNFTASNTIGYNLDDTSERGKIIAVVSPASADSERIVHQLAKEHENVQLLQKISTAPQDGEVHTQNVCLDDFYRFRQEIIGEHRPFYHQKNPVIGWKISGVFEDLNKGISFVSNVPFRYMPDFTRKFGNDMYFVGLQSKNPAERDTSLINTFVQLRGDESCITEEDFYWMDRIREQSYFDDQNIADFVDEHRFDLVIPYKEGMPAELIASAIDYFLFRDICSVEGNMIPDENEMYSLARRGIER